MDGVDQVHRLLIACDEAGDPGTLVPHYLELGYEIDTARGVGPACAALRRQEFSVVLADLHAADDAALAIVRAARRTRPAPHVIVTLPRQSDDAPLILALLREAAYVCLRHPIDRVELDELVASACAEVGRERELARPPVFQRGARDLARWNQAQGTLEDALVAVAALGPEATPDVLSVAADEVGRWLRTQRHPSLDAFALETIGQALHEWARQRLLGEYSA